MTTERKGRVDQLYQQHTNRNDAPDYTPDQLRVAKYLNEFGVGGGEDPVGFLIDDHRTLVAERNEMRKTVEEVTAQLEALRSNGK